MIQEIMTLILSRGKRQSLVFYRTLIAKVKTILSDNDSHKSLDCAFLGSDGITVESISAYLKLSNVRV